MEKNHRLSIENVTRHFQNDEEVLALLLCGSLAHGFATSGSDIDLMILIPDESYRERYSSNNLQFFNTEMCNYPGGYVDGKYIGPNFLAAVEEKGSEPARFAFRDARVLFTRINGLEETIRRIATYPVVQKKERIRRFFAQFEAWHWYTGEALKHQNRYLLGLATQKMVLFGGRMILAHNEQLYPFHKWFLSVLAQVEEKPAGLLEQIERLSCDPGEEAITIFYDTIRNFREWEKPDISWPNQFMLDSEWNWIDGNTPVDDL